MREQIASELQSPATSILAIGLVSGTSQDGVDVAQYGKAAVGYLANNSDGQAGAGKRLPPDQFFR